MSTWRIEPLLTLDQIDDVLAIERVSFANPWTREMYVTEFENRDVSHCYLAKNDEGDTIGFC